MPISIRKRYAMHETASIPRFQFAKSLARTMAYRCPARRWVNGNKWLVTCPCCQRHEGVMLYPIPRGDVRIECANGCDVTRILDAFGFGLTREDLHCPFERSTKDREEPVTHTTIAGETITRMRRVYYSASHMN